MSDHAALREAADRACARIAPTWPLDRFIAVNPFWPLTNRPLQEVAGDLAALSGGRLIMPRQWYAEEWRAGRLRSEHLRQAIVETGSEMTEDDLVALFWSGEPAPSQRPLVVDTLETLRHSEHELTWRDFVMDKISRFCASYFDHGQTQISGVREGGFYASWKIAAQSDQAPFVFMALGRYRATVDQLPATADEMIALACSDLTVSVQERERYFSALLLDVNGWASWCAYLSWMARLEGGDDPHLRELLAIRLGWEWLLFRSSDETISAEWRLAMTSWPGIDRAARTVFADDWILQRAAEIAFLSQLRPKLPQGFDATRPAAPRVQAAFCLDVRSEVFRRAFEAQGDVQTLGVAGFFGVPAEYQPLAADDARPQLPGLLGPKFRVTDTGVPNNLEAKRRGRLNAKNAWKAFKYSSLSSFAFVDAIGLFFARDMFRDAFRAERHPANEHERAGLKPTEGDKRMPRLTSHMDGEPLSPDERCNIAAGLVRAMGLTRDFARLVLHVGHGSETRNNPHAAGLDCGACGGQPGEVNVRAAAALLNDPEVRAGLVARGIDIPPTTLFVGGLHNTTIDEVTLFDEGAAPTTHQADLADARAMLDRAGTATRRERAPRLGIGNLTDAELHAAVLKRARNWAEVRPEWGLAGNAAFI
ncbi:MAG TPA: putative inorganic carbon transporter subunit DabA, partial [Candidatus Limnocylindrales bacterium]|nr:putative inorganic carbon transporter subunit DabA [Candidatus Limnocylindrales bacterium]